MSYSLTNQYVMEAPHIGKENILKLFLLMRVVYVINFLI